MSARPPPLPAIPSLPTLTFGGDGLPIAPSSPSSSSPSNSHTTEALQDIAFGSLAGSIGKIIEYPFDTVKVRLQSQSLSAPLYIGPLDCFRQSIRRDGVLRGLYRGISAPIVGAAIETSSLFFSYRIAQDLLIRTPMYKDVVDRKALPLAALVACGAASGAFTSVLLTPIELVKCQMQVPLEAGSLRGPGPLAIMAKVFRHHGVLGFWHGQLGTLIRETGGSAAWFGSYEGMSAVFRRFDDRQGPHPAPPSSHPSTTIPVPGQSAPPLPIWQQLLAGAMAGVTYNFAFFPADTIKSRMQTEDFGPGNSSAAQSAQVPAANNHKYGAAYASEVTEADAVTTTRVWRQSFWGAGKALWEQQGLRGMYRGCGITIARAAPSSAFIFAIYEGLRSWWG